MACNTNWRLATPCGSPCSVVDAELLGNARRTHGGSTDAELIDEALTALLARDRSAEVDHTYATAYTARPINESDEWGDLASFRHGGRPHMSGTPKRGEVCWYEPPDIERCSVRPPETAPCSRALRFAYV